MRTVGNRVRRTEDARILTGGATYCADVRDPLLEGALHATFVRSTFAHARLRDIDVAEAKAMPGVAGVVTGADVDLAPMVAFLPGAAKRMARPFLATDRVRFVGEPLAVVLTERADQGQDAAEAVIVDYEPLPAVVDAESAVEDTVLLYPDVGTNTAVTFGEAARDDAFFHDCEVVVGERLVNQRLAACPLEGRSSAAAWAPDGRLHLWCSTQNAHGVRDAVVEHYGIEADEVRVVAPDVGGGFGPKIGAHAEDLLLPWLARRAGRPVRWTETRAENMVAMGQGRGQVQLVEIGGDRDGRIRAYRLAVLQDAGAYPEVGAFLPYLTRLMAPGTYAIGRIECTTASVVTNTTPVRAYRGAGRPEATAAIERAVDLFAAEVEMDPALVRARNLVPAFQRPHTTAVGTTYDTGDYLGALDRALLAAGYDELRAEQEQRRASAATAALGIGMACYVEVTAGPTAGREYARIEIRDDGSALVHTGASPHGQGHHTGFAMVASDELGIPFELVTVVHGDTDVVARGVGTFGSRSVQLGASAVIAAAHDLLQQGREAAAATLGIDVAGVAFDAETGRFVESAQPERGCTWRYLAKTNELAAEHEFEAAQPTFPFGAHVAVVEVDVETGAVRLLRHIACDDAGTIINPLLADGQRHGGIAQGVAQALYEEVRFDADGNPLTTSLADYAFVSAPELPLFELVDMATPTWVNPLGAKGIGESGTIGATPAVQNAVCDALAHLGVRHVDLPCTPERVWRAIQDAQARAAEDDA